jgi:hypothetical protein
MLSFECKNAVDRADWMDGLSVWWHSECGACYLQLKLTYAQLKLEVLGCRLCTLEVHQKRKNYDALVLPKPSSRTLLAGWLSCSTGDNAAFDLIQRRGKALATD